MFPAQTNGLLSTHPGYLCPTANSDYRFISGGNHQLQSPLLSWRTKQQLLTHAIPESVGGIHLWDCYQHILFL